MSMLTGTLTLTRLIVRRDRLILPAWILLGVGVLLLNTASLAALYPTPQARQAVVAESMTNPVLGALLGPILRPSIEAIVAWRSTTQGLVIAGVAGVLLVIRHTRTEEETGRRELLGSAPVGRLAGLTAVLGLVFAANLLIAVVLAGALIAGPGYPVAGSFAFPLSIAAAGCCFAAVAAVAAQLASSAALARNLGIGVLAASFAPAVLGSADAPPLPMWLSPVGWTRGIRAYAGERWEVLLIPIAVVVALTAVACALAARRDLDTGVLPDRSGAAGPARAAPALRSPLALAWRLSRGQLISSAGGLCAVAALLGWAAASFDDLFPDASALQGWLATTGQRTLGESFLALLTFDVRLLVACVAIGTALRLRTEETSGHTDPVIAGPTSRLRWLAGHSAVAFAGPSALLVASGASGGLVYAAATGRAAVVWGQLESALRFLPAAWFMAALAIALFGLVPRAAVAASWGAMVACVVAVLLWEVGAIGETAFLATPVGYSHPAAHAGALAPAVVALLAVLLTAVGAVAFRSRDVGV